MIEKLIYIIGIILIVLKLCQVGLPATWSWWAVTAPIWGLWIALGFYLTGITVWFKIKNWIEIHKIRSNKRKASR